MVCSNHSRTFYYPPQTTVVEMMSRYGANITGPFGPELGLILIYAWVLADSPAVRVTGLPELVTAHRGDGRLWLNFIIIFIKKCTLRVPCGRLHEVHYQHASPVLAYFDLYRCLPVSFSWLNQIEDLFESPPCYGRDLSIRTISNFYVNNNESGMKSRHDVSVTASSSTWVSTLGKERNILGPERESYKWLEEIVSWFEDPFFIRFY
jgi:hypothetical protein